MKGKKLSGLSIPEALVVLAIIASLAAIVTPAYVSARNKTYVTRCVANLHEIGVAIERYKLDHQGALPWPLGELETKGYLDREALICPFVQAIAPDLALRLRNAKRNRSSYFLYSQKGLDRLRQQGKIAFGFSEVLERRGGDTPVVVCRNHRECAIRTSREELKKPRWYIPEAPVIILRWNGTVTTTLKGGSFADHSWSGNEQDLTTL